jgi:PKD repeat protein
MAGITRFTFTSGSTTDPDGNPLTYAWNFGDGTTATGATVTRIFANTGTFTVVVTVSDGSATVSAAGISVKVAPNLSIPNWGADQIGPGYTCSGFADCARYPLTPTFPLWVLRLQQHGTTLSGSIRAHATCNGAPAGTPIAVKGTMTSSTYPTKVQLTSDAFCLTPSEGSRTFTLETNEDGTRLTGEALVVPVLYCKDQPQTSLSQYCRDPVPGPVAIERCGSTTSSGPAFACSLYGG